MSFFSLSTVCFVHICFSFGFWLLFGFLYLTVNFKRFFGTILNNDNSFYRENLAIYINCSHRRCCCHRLRRRRRQYSTFFPFVYPFFLHQTNLVELRRVSQKKPVRIFIFFISYTLNLCEALLLCISDAKRPKNTSYMYPNAWYPLYDWFDTSEKMVVWPKKK